MTRQRIEFIFLNIGHFFDHLFMLVFAAVAALVLAGEWSMSYAELIPYATPGFIAFGLFGLPAGWIGDKWSRQGMMAVFFIGAGACSILTGMAQTPLGIGAGLFAIGVFAAIYHPVGLALVIHGRTNTGMALALNGVFGNIGTAGAALIAGFFIDLSGWRAAFVLPGAASILTGIAYSAFVLKTRERAAAARAKAADEAAARAARAPAPAIDRHVLMRVFAIIFFSTAMGGLIYQSTTFAMPKVFDERLSDLAGSASLVGGYVFIALTIASIGQLTVGYLIDRHSIRTVFAAIAVMQAGFAAVLLQLSGTAMLVTCALLMAAVFGQLPINDALVGRITRSEWRSRAIALRYVVTIAAMSLAIPLIAWIHARWDFSVLFFVLAGAAGLTLTAVLMLPRISVVTGGAVAAE
ncbi:MAG: MFS transporter [Rhodospirillales bacterium]|nr:MFS transporter [Rhodospirillales bacterium]